MHSSSSFFQIEKGLIDPSTPVPPKRKRTHTLKSNAGASGSTSSTTSTNATTTGEASGSGTGNSNINPGDGALVATPSEIDEDHDDIPDAEMSGDFSNEAIGNGNDELDMEELMRNHQENSEDQRDKGKEKEKDSNLSKGEDLKNSLAKSTPQVQVETKSESTDPTSNVSTGSASQIKPEVSTDIRPNQEVSQNQNHNETIQFNPNDLDHPSSHSQDQNDGNPDDSLNLDFDPNDIGRMAMEMNVDGMTFDLSSIQSSNQDGNEQNNHHSLIGNGNGNGNDTFVKSNSDDFLSNSNSSVQPSSMTSIDHQQNQSSTMSHESSTHQNVSIPDQNQKDQQQADESLGQNANDSGNLIPSSSSS